MSTLRGQRLTPNAADFPMQLLGRIALDPIAGAALIAPARDPPSRANHRLPPGSLDLLTMVAIVPKGQQLARRPAQPRQTFRARTPLQGPCRGLPLLL
jgi:hypothetical protein